MKFSKYHGSQNDFILVVGDASDGVLDAVTAQRLCERHAGIGADGVALILRPERDGGLFAMRIINSDGSRPEMCGNALRCVVKHLVDERLVDDSGAVSVQTDAGVLSAAYEKDAADRVAVVQVDMGPPRTPIVARALEALGRTFHGHTVSMGNPHFVVGSEEPLADARAFGLALSTHPGVPGGINVSFVRKRDAMSLDAVVFERGAGLTMACGTGACALVAVAHATGLITAGAETAVHLPGGVLTIGVNDQRMLMRGPAVRVFDGSLSEAARAAFMAGLSDGGNPPDSTDGLRWHTFSS